MARPTVAVQGTADSVPLPEVFLSPVRLDVVRSVHTGIAKNNRQPYAVNVNAGKQTAAESWGTGRAVSRIPRVPGGGTHRAGQGAFGNMCRGGRMFSPTKTWRKWHRKVNIKQKRYATCAALAATAVPALVEARGHKIGQVPEVPLVLDVGSLSKTSKAVETLKGVGAYDDCEKAKDSRAVRTGKGKMRNRRYVSRKGPLVVYATGEDITKAFRNVPGVELSCVDRLNLLQLAPGGHMGRFCVWTKAAFEKLDAIFGTAAAASTVKAGFRPPAPMMTNSDLNRIINSDEIQSVVNPIKTSRSHAEMKYNPLKNKAAMHRLNPYAEVMRKEQAALEKNRAANRAAKLKAGRSKASKEAGKKFYQQMLVDFNYEGELFDGFNTWLKSNEAKVEEEE